MATIPTISLVCNQCNSRCCHHLARTKQDVESSFRLNTIDALANLNERLSVIEGKAVVPDAALQKRIIDSINKLNERLFQLEYKSDLAFIAGTDRLDPAVYGEGAHLQYCIKCKTRRCKHTIENPVFCFNE
jgi:hypothetical protein